MIRRVYSDLQKFKTLTFKPGFNVLLADKSPGATDRHTRNRAGKSSLLEILHFLLGGKCDKDSLFKAPALQDAMFGMEFELAGRFVRVERTGVKPTPVVVEGEYSHWPIPPATREDGQHLSNENWKVVLGSLMFGLGEFPDSWSPSFRSLVSYFVRRERAGCMTKAMVQGNRQQLVDQQVNISFLLGLDWTVPHAWHEVREREKQLEQLKKSLGEGAFGTVIGSASSLKSDLVIAQDRVRRLRASVLTFQVVDEYHELEREASALTRKLAALADDNMLDQRYLSELERSSVQETAPAPADLEALYREAGVVLPDLVKKRFDDVKGFHERRFRADFGASRNSGTVSQIRGSN